ncbi:MAG: UDP binding domain-containing protein [Candidatus Omnitrophica bacterium]|nr:UDP binding domain-containing protein [Candidatus Omnitrophota bacterium]MDD5512162.1 UDP binding domain-containing protein [Candidatus Omnitrophota bacterium]
MAQENIFLNKTVSVWGLGYLGYTTICKLQNSGFKINAFDLKTPQLEAFRNRNYPDRNQRAVWSISGYLPQPDYERVKIAKTPKEMFAGTLLHIITIPESHKNIGSENIAARLADLFAKYLKKGGARPLVVFESAFIPGHIENNFVEKLKKANLLPGRDYYLGTMFRTDWSFESFMAGKDRLVISSCDARGLAAVGKLSAYFEMPVVALNSVKEAEIYVNSIAAIQAMAIDFMRQLAIGYPGVDLGKISRSIFRNMNFDDCKLNIGTGGAKMTFAIDYLIEGSANQESLTLLKEFQDINISSVLTYAEYLIRSSYKSVAILGVTYKGNQKDLTLSPSVTMAEYLLKNSLKVILHDPFCSSAELNKYVKGAKVSDFPGSVFDAEVIVVACDHNQYKTLRQNELKRIKKHTKLVIDNYGIWDGLDFGKNIKYHRVGDGTLNLAK